MPFSIQSLIDARQAIRQMELVTRLLPLQLSDPGDGGTLPTSRGAYIEMVTSGAETRTLPAPTYVGQMMILIFQGTG